MKLLLSSVLALFPLVTGSAVTTTNGSSQAQQIARFFNSTSAPSFLQQLPRYGNSSTSSVANFSWSNANHPSMDLHWMAGDSSALFNQLSAPLPNHQFDASAVSNLQSFISNLHLDPGLTNKLDILLNDVRNGILSDHHFDPNALGDLQMFIDNLHLDPGLTARLDTLLQDLKNGHFDSSALTNLESIIDGLHLDPALAAKLDMFLQDLGQCDFHSGDNDQDEDDGLPGGDDDDQGSVQVPEPGTFALVAAGAALLAGTFLRRRRF
jgi:uncharacterized membrane-anchored protein YjiN (DUF445 family)